MDSRFSTFPLPCLCLIASVYPYIPLYTLLALLLSCCLIFGIIRACPGGPRAELHSLPNHHHRRSKALKSTSPPGHYRGITSFSLTAPTIRCFAHCHARSPTSNISASTAATSISLLLPPPRNPAIVNGSTYDASVASRPRLRGRAAQSMHTV